MRSSSACVAFASGAANHVRLTSMTYPNSRQIDYDYGSSGGMNDVLGLAPVHDRAGNMTRMPKPATADEGFTATYDA